jgi:hypothetical protein
MSDNYTSQINAAFEALKYNPHATQQLLQQQQHNPGSAQGPETLAAAAAANYQKSLQTPPSQPMPQQSVVAGLTQQPQMPMGLEAPYLEDFAQQQQQQRMATGGIVALAHGGPVQGYAAGGNFGIDWGSYAPELAHESTGHWLDRTLGKEAARQERYPVEEDWGKRLQEMPTTDSYGSPLDRADAWLTKMEHKLTPSTALKNVGFSEMSPSTWRGKKGLDQPSLLDALNSSQNDTGSEDTETATGSPIDDLSLIGGRQYPRSEVNSYPHSDQLDTTADILKTSETPTPKTTTPPGGQTISTSEPQQPRPRQELEAPKKADGSHLSYEDQISYIQKVLGVPPDVSAEIKGQLEKRMAHEGNVNLIKDIAAGIGGFLGTRGYGQERVGAGIMNALQSSAIHGKQESEMQDKIDALQLKSMMLPYESRHQAGTLFLQNQQKLREAQAAAAARQAELSYERGTKLITGQQEGEYGLKKEGLQGKNAQALQEAKAKEDRLLAAFEHKLKTSENLTQKDILTAYSSVAGHLAGSDLGYTPEEIRNKIAPYMGPYASMLPGGTPPAPAQQLGNGLSLSGTPTTR